MGKFTYIVSLLMMCFLLAACGSGNSNTLAESQNSETTGDTESQQTSLSESDIQKILDEKIEQLKSEGNYSTKAYGYDQLEVVKFYETPIPQILTITDIEGKDVIRVHNYNQEAQNWDIVYENSEYDNYDGFERLNILDKGPLKESSDLEHAIIGNHSGNGGYLNFFIIGEKDGEITVLMDQMYLNSQYQGNVKIEGHEVVIYSFDNTVIARLSINNSYDSTVGDENLQVVQSIQERLNSSDLTHWEKGLISYLDKERWDSAHGASTMAGYYSTNQSEVDQFLKDIIEEYETNRYKDYIDYDFYTLRNIFKSYVVYKFYKKDKNDPLTVFAENFYKYINESFRGTMNMGNADENEMQDELKASYEALNN